MAVQRFSGFVYTGVGVAVVGATIDIFARNTLTAQTTVPATVTTDANGYWTATVAAETRCDVRITNGSSITWLKYDDEIQIEGIEVAVLRLRNPADTFDYDIVPAAITADRQLNLPLLTGTATLAAIDEGNKGADIASGATLTLVAGSDFADVTGTTTVTAISTRPAGSRFTFQFDGALTLTHNATTLILQGSVNLVTAAGDMVTFISEGGGNWREKSRRLAAAAATAVARATQAALEAETDEATYASPNRVKFSPGVAKGWCNIAADGTLDTPSYNITSITDVTTGVRDIVWNVDFSSAVYVIVGGSLSTTTCFAKHYTLAVGSVRLDIRNAGDTASIDAITGSVAYGDQ